MYVGIDLDTVPTHFISPLWVKLPHGLKAPNFGRDTTFGGMRARFPKQVNMLRYLSILTKGDQILVLKCVWVILGQKTYFWSFLGN